MLKVRLVSIKFNTQVGTVLPCKPSIGDSIPINHTKEVVNKVFFVTKMLIDQDATLKGTELLVYLD